MFLIAPLRTKPLSQYLQIHLVHPQNKLPSMDVVDGKDVVLVKDDLIAIVQSVQPSFVQRVVHDRIEELPITFCDLSPEVLSPAT